MLEVILDVETTGLSTTENHRIVEIGCIELNNQIATNKIFHEYINPERSISEEAFKIHGYDTKFLSDKKNFNELAESFLNFIKNKKLIIHNAGFDLSFLNHELKLIKKKGIDNINIVDTLDLARKKFPGSQNSLDALCKRFKIDNSKRKKHNALIDCELLLKVYVNLLDQKTPKFDFANENLMPKNIDNISYKKQNYSKKIIEVNNEEFEKHKIFLQRNLKKNFY